MPGVPKKTTVRAWPDYLQGKTPSGDIVHPELWISAKDVINPPSVGSNHVPSNLSGHATIAQSTSTEQPSWEGDHWYFDGTEWLRVNGFTETLDSLTWVIVGEQVSGSTSSGQGIDHYDGSTAFIDLHYWTVGDWSVSVRDDSSTDNDINVTESGNAGEPFITTFSTNDSEGQAARYRDSSNTKDTTDATSVGSHTSTERNICGRYDGTGQIEIRIHEVIMFDQGLSRSFVTNTLIPDLKTKWNV